MTTVRDLCTDALIELGVLDPSESMDAGAAGFALRTLNRLLAKWNTEELMVYTINRETFNLTAGQQTYTLGTGGDFATNRPVRTDMASVLINTGSLPLELPLDILTDEEWRNLNIKQTGSVFPTKVWFTGNVPLNSLWFWPIPMDSTVQVVLYDWGRTTAFSGIGDTVIFPDGYEEALVTNLAMYLCSSYGVQPSPTLASRAISSKAAIESLNMEPVYASIDSALLGGGGFSRAVKSQGLLVDP